MLFLVELNHSSAHLIFLKINRIKERHVISLLDASSCPVTPKAATKLQKRPPAPTLILLYSHLLRRRRRLKSRSHVLIDGMVGSSLCDRLCYFLCCCCRDTTTGGTSTSAEEEMDGEDGEIIHRMVAVNGISMHVAEKGEGPVVLLIHGFPELWYTWRHQIHGLAARGYHAVAPDLRGFGDTDAPPSVASYTSLHVVGDLVALIDSLGQDQVFVVGHDWGAMTAWSLCMYRPDRVRAVVNLSVPFTPRNPARKPIESLKALYGDDYYMCSFQEPGVMEAEFARLGTSLVMKKFITYRSPSPLFIPKEWDSPDAQISLPDWVTDEDINYYTSKFEKTGFTGGFNYYRSLDLNWELTSPWTGVQIKVPAKFIVGDLDITYNSPGMKNYINQGGLKKYIPNLQEIVIMEDVGHFINEEKPQEITMHIYTFIKKY